MSGIAERLYALRQAMRLLVRHPGRFLLAVVLTAAALELPLVVIALGVASAPALKAAKPGPEISLFVKIGTAPRELEALRAQLSALEGVASVRVIPRDQAFAELSKRAKLSAGAADNRPNPLPDTLIARFSLDADPAVIDRAAAAARQWPGVDGVQADIDWYRRLAAFKRVGLVIATATAGATALLIAAALSAAVLLVVQLRSDEIRVLQCVGASPSFVRRPCAYAAGVAFAAGAAVALVMGWAGLQLFGPGAASVGLVLPAVPPWWPAVLIGAAGLAGGAAGGVAAWLEMRRFTPW